jgi:predicted nucleic acid-binding protein
VIVADVNLLAYLLIDGEFTELAEKAYARDRRWVAPRSHRFELLNVMATNVRGGKIDLAQAGILFRRAFRMVSTPWDVESMDVLRLSVESRHATYDCEYIVLARQRRLRVVTHDQKMLEKFPDVAVSIELFSSGK